MKRGVGVLVRKEQVVGKEGRAFEGGLPNFLTPSLIALKGLIPQLCRAKCRQRNPKPVSYFVRHIFPLPPPFSDDMARKRSWPGCVQRSNGQERTSSLILESSDDIMRTPRTAWLGRASVPCERRIGRFREGGMGGELRLGGLVDGKSQSGLDDAE